MGENENFPKLPGTLIELRKKKKCSLREVSEHTGITAAALSAYEQGTKTPILVNAAKLADFYGVTLDELVGRAAPKPEPGRNFVEAAKAYHLMRTYASEPPKVNVEKWFYCGSEKSTRLISGKYEDIVESDDFDGFLIGDDGFPKTCAVLHFTLFDDKLSRFVETYENLQNLMNDGQMPKAVFELWLKDQFEKGG